MMKYILPFALLLLARPSNSQSQPSPESAVADTASHFVYLLNGKFLGPSDCEVEPKLFGDAFSYKNGDKIRGKEIKFYKHEKGYFANITSLNKKGKPTTTAKFSKRISAGTFDLFYSEDHNYTSSRSGGGTTRVTRNFHYAKGFGDINPFKYDNLKVDLTNAPNHDFPDREIQISTLLETGKRNEKKIKTLNITGASLLLSGIILYYKRNSFGSSQSGENESGKWASLALSGAGLGCMSGIFFIERPHNLYLDAMKTYNSTYSE